MVANPFFGRLSDRTTSHWGMRQPWMVMGLVGGTVGIAVVGVAPSIAAALVGWCLSQVMFNAVLSAMAAVLPDQVPSPQRGQISGLLGISMPVASVAGTHLVQLFTGSTLVMFLAPCVVGGVAIVLFVVTFHDRRLQDAPEPRSMRELAGTLYVAPQTNPEFAWVFASRFLFVLAYAFLTTYQVYYLFDQLGSDEADVPHLIFVSTVVQSSALVVASPTGGPLSDWAGRRKPFVVSAALVYGVALFVIALAPGFEMFLVGMALSVAKDLGVLNIAGALPFAVVPALASVILSVGGGSYGVLYVVAGVSAVGGALAVLPIRGVR